MACMHDSDSLKDEQVAGLCLFLCIYQSIHQPIYLSVSLSVLYLSPNKAEVRHFLQEWNFKALRTKLWRETSFASGTSDPLQTHCVRQRFCNLHETLPLPHKMQVDPHTSGDRQFFANFAFGFRYGPPHPSLCRAFRLSRSSLTSPLDISGLPALQSGHLWTTCGFLKVAHFETSFD